MSSVYLYDLNFNTESKFQCFSCKHQHFQVKNLACKQNALILNIVAENCSCLDGFD